MTKDGGICYKSKFVLIYHNLIITIFELHFSALVFSVHYTLIPIVFRPKLQYNKTQKGRGAMAEILTQYKLLILYMLHTAEFPLTGKQLVNFFLEKNYTDYFTANKALGELLTAEMIYAEEKSGNPRYSLSQSGKETLSYFPEKISPALTDDVVSYYKANKLKLKQEASVTSDFRRVNHGQYAVRCQIKENGQPSFDLTLFAYSKEQAEAACLHWQAKHQTIFDYLMDNLMG